MLHLLGALPQKVHYIFHLTAVTVVLCYSEKIMAIAFFLLTEVLIPASIFQELLLTHVNCSMLVGCSAERIKKAAR